MHRLPQLYMDLDGVLADFDTQHEWLFGTRPLRSLGNNFDAKDENMWQRIRETPGFFRGMPLMIGALQLWNFAARNGAWVLSGVSDRNPVVHVEKRQWVRKHLGKNVPLITCPSSEKYLYAHPGDVLVDDWIKYKGAWEKAGGIW